ncbi:uncharacterized protein METZ01_LOCUS338311, partial [marine metagenome]
MKKILVIIFTIASVCVSAQIFDPVSWEFTQHHLSDNEIELQFKASIEDKWHVYSQFIEGDGPVPTEFTFITAAGYELVDAINEGKSIEEFDPNFEMILKYFEHEVIFTQKIKVISSEDFKIEGNVYFMVCDEKQCLPPEEVEFLFEIKGVDGGTTIVSEDPLEEKEAEGMWGLFFLAFL